MLSGVDLMGEGLQGVRRLAAHAGLAEVGAAIERRTKAPVELLDPFRDIAVDLKEVNGDLLNLHRAQVAVAIGLALRKDREKA